MWLGKEMLTWSLLHLFLFSILLGTGKAACSYEIKDLWRERVTSISKAIYSTMDVGTNVFTVYLRRIQNRKRRSVDSTQHDIAMISSSSNYEMIFVDDANHHEVVVKNCLQTGHREYLSFSVNETLPYSDCGVWILETHVQPSVPNFSIPDSVTVRVSTCFEEVDILELEFENGGNCSSWSCFAKCKNDKEKIFWTEGRTLRTSSYNTNFNFTYEIRVRCLDETAGSFIDETTGDTTLHVTFIDAAETCTEAPVTGTTTLTSSSSSSSSSSAATTTATTTTTATAASTTSTINEGVVKQQSDPVDFFQKPENVASLAFSGGFIVGLLIGFVIYVVAKRNACK